MTKKVLYKIILLISSFQFKHYMCVMYTFYVMYAYIIFKALIILPPLELSIHRYVSFHISLCQKSSPK